MRAARAYERRHCPRGSTPVALEQFRPALGPRGTPAPSAQHLQSDARSRRKGAGKMRFHEGIQPKAEVGYFHRGSALRRGHPVVRSPPLSPLFT